MAALNLIQHLEIDSGFDSDISEDERVASRKGVLKAECYTRFDLVLERADIVETVASLLRSHGNDDYYAYERGDYWYVGLGSRMTLLVDSEGKNVTVTTPGKTKVRQVHDSLPEIARKFVLKSEKN